MGRTTARLPLSEWTSPSSRSAMSVPENTRRTLLPPTTRKLAPGPCRRADPARHPLAVGGRRVRFLRARLLAHLEGLDHVLDLDVVERPQADTALIPVANLGHVVLEAAQRLDGQIVGAHHAVADQPGLRVPVDGAAADDRAGDVADLRDTEDLADLRRTERDLLVLRLEHALEGRLDLLDRLVDHRVVPDVDTLAVGQLCRLTLGPDVE